MPQSLDSTPAKIEKEGNEEERGRAMLSSAVLQTLHLSTIYLWLTVIYNIFVALFPIPQLLGQQLMIYKHKHTRLGSCGSAAGKAIPVTLSLFPHTGCHVKSCLWLLSQGTCFFSMDTYNPKDCVGNETDSGWPALCSALILTNQSRRNLPTMNNGQCHKLETFSLKSSPQSTPLFVHCPWT